MGDIFYLPRSYKNISIETIIVNGNEYSRKVVHYEPVVKAVKIVSMEVKITKNKQTTQYFLHNIDPKTKETINLPIMENTPSYRFMSEKSLDKAFSDYGNAENFANEYAIHRKQEYLGD